jgi:hypothetical protein
MPTVLASPARRLSPHGTSWSKRRGRVGCIRNWRRYWPGSRYVESCSCQQLITLLRCSHERSMPHYHDLDPRAHQQRPWHVQSQGRPPSGLTQAAYAALVARCRRSLAEHAGDLRGIRCGSEPLLGKRYAVPSVLHNLSSRLKCNTDANSPDRIAMGKCSLLGRSLYPPPCGVLSVGGPKWTAFEPSRGHCPPLRRAPKTTVIQVLFYTMKIVSG